MYLQPIFIFTFHQTFSDLFVISVKKQIVNSTIATLCKPFSLDPFPSPLEVTTVLKVINGSSSPDTFFCILLSTS